jgi:hypothetical protein
MSRPASDEGPLTPFPTCVSPSDRDVCPQLAAFNTGRNSREERARACLGNETLLWYEDSAHGSPFAA